MTRKAATLMTFATAGLALTLHGCGPKAPPGAPPAPLPFAEAILYDTTGVRTGKVTMVPQGSQLAGKIDITGGLAPGMHGMHIHATGQCTPPEFTSAGGHLNPGAKEHGQQNPAGRHEGDLPMLEADARGRASASFTAGTTMDALFDADGAAFVIHADADDMRTDPTGNSGARVMCGVLFRKLN